MFWEEVTSCAYLEERVVNNTDGTQADIKILILKTKWFSGRPCMTWKRGTEKETKSIKNKWIELMKIAQDWGQWIAVIVVPGPYPVKGGRLHDKFFVVMVFNIFWTWQNVSFQQF